MRRALLAAVLLLLLPAGALATVTSQTALNLYTGNGAQTVYPYTFRILSNGDIAVAVGGVVQTLTTNYTVSSVGAQNGGNITFLVAPPNGAAITFSRSVPLTQTTDYVENAPFSAETLERNLDKLTMIAQRIATGSVSGPVNLPGLTIPSPGSGLCLAWNTAGTQLEAKACGNITVTGASTPNLVTPQTFGAVGDGVANDTSAVTSAGAVAGVYTTAGAVYNTTTAWNAFGGPFWGWGRLKDSGGHFRGRYHTRLFQAPSAYGSTDSPITGFDGDLTRVPFPVEHQISGVATLGQPASGYMQTPETSPHYTYLYNASGHNQATGGNSGRTGVAAHFLKVDNVGQGDAGGVTVIAFANSTRPSSTHVLANPAAYMYNGSTFAGTNGVYLQGTEMNLIDQGFDVAGVGAVYNLTRTNATGAKSAFWYGVRVQSSGTEAVDALFSGIGVAHVGIDLAGYTSDTGGTWGRTAMMIRGNDRIYFNASAPAAPPNLSTNRGAEYLVYDTAAQAFGFVVAGNPQLQIRSGSVTALGLLTGAESGVAKWHLRAQSSEFQLRDDTNANTNLAITNAGQATFRAILFANLGTPSNGAFVYCSDCTFANPCAGAGSGAFAKRLNGAWRCD